MSPLSYVGAAGAAAAASTASCAPAVCMPINRTSAASPSSASASLVLCDPMNARLVAKIFLTVVLPVPFTARSNCLDAHFAGANAHRLRQLDHEHLAVADLAGARHVADGLDDLLGDRVVDGELDLGLRQEIDAVLRAAIQLGVAALSSEALHFGHRDALHPDVRDGLADVIELERLDDRGDQLHGVAARKCIFYATNLRDQNGAGIACTRALRTAMVRFFRALASRRGISLNCRPWMHALSTIWRGGWQLPSPPASPRYAATSRTTSKRCCSRGCRASTWCRGRSSTFRPRSCAARARSSKRSKRVWLRWKTARNRPPPGRSGVRHSR